MVGRSRASITVLVAGGYILIGGLAFLAVPAAAMAALGLSASHEIWPRVFGGVVVEVAILYLYAGRADSRSFAVGSIYARLWVALLVAALVLLGQLGWGALAIAVADSGSAAWTWLTLRSEHRHTY